MHRGLSLANSVTRQPWSRSSPARVSIAARFGARKAQAVRRGEHAAREDQQKQCDAIGGECDPRPGEFHRSKWFFHPEIRGDGAGERDRHQQDLRRRAQRMAAHDQRIAQPWPMPQIERIRDEPHCD